jgi:hypothetical protein
MKDDKAPFKVMAKAFPGDKGRFSHTCQRIAVMAGQTKKTRLASIFSPKARLTMVTLYVSRRQGD